MAGIFTIEIVEVTNAALDAAYDARRKLKYDAQLMGALSDRLASHRDLQTEFSWVSPRRCYAIQLRPCSTVEPKLALADTRSDNKTVIVSALFLAKKCI